MEDGVGVSKLRRTHIYKGNSYVSKHGLNCFILLASHLLLESCTHNLNLSLGEFHFSARKFQTDRICRFPEISDGLKKTAGSDSILSKFPQHSNEIGLRLLHTALLLTRQCNVIYIVPCSTLYCTSVQQVFGYSNILEYLLTNMFIRQNICSTLGPQIYFDIHWLDFLNFFFVNI